MKPRQLGTPPTKTTLFALAFALPFFSAAQAQQQLEVIEVTAQFRSEDVQNVPISTSTLAGDVISELDINDATDVARMVPGMTFAEFAPGQALISMRGIVSADDGAGMDNSVVVFLDGIYIGRLANVNFDLFEIERIEVLRGPQGTLAGRNAIGGAINIITRRPAADFNAKASATKGNYDITRLYSSVNGRLTDNMVAKLSLNLRQRDGFTRNVVLDEDNQNENTDAVRGQLSVDSNFGYWDLSFDYATDERGDMGRTPIVNGNFDYISVWRALGGEPYKATSPISGFSHRTLKGIGIQGTHQWHGGELTTILGWRDSATDWEMASVGAPLGGNYDLANGVFGADVNDDIIENIEQYSLEMRYSASISKGIDYTVGLFYLTEETERVEQFKLDFNTRQNGQVTLGNEVSEQYNQTTSVAAYSQLQWQINSDWKFTAGARLTRESKDSRFVTLNCGHSDVEIVVASNWCDSGSGSLGILQQSFSVDVAETWHDVSPRVALQYAPKESMMFYGSISKGFKSGGFPGAPGLQEVAERPIEPEVAINYELGFKTDLAANRLRLNGSVFYTDYRNLQVGWFGPSQINPGFGSFVTTNIEDSEIKGAEFEFQWVAHEYLTLSGNYGYLATQVNDFLLDTFAGELDLSGSDLRQAPRHKLYLATDWSYPLGKNRGKLELNLNYQFTDEQISDYINQDVILEAHELVNARLAWSNNDATMDIALWAKNLLDEEYISHAYVIGPGIIGTWGAPRTVGVTLSVTFQ